MSARLRGAVGAVGLVAQDAATTVLPAIVSKVFVACTVDSVAGVTPIAAGCPMPTIAATPDWEKMPTSRTSGGRLPVASAAGMISPSAWAAAPEVMVQPASYR